MNARYEIMALPAWHVATVRHVGPYPGIGEAFGRLHAWAAPRGLARSPETQSLAVYYDDPDTTAAEALRSDACLTVPPGTPGDAEVGIMDIPGGLFAVGHFEIDPTEFGQAWDRLTGEYLPTTAYVPDDRLCYERYLNDPDRHPQHKFIVDICEPVRPAS